METGRQVREGEGQGNGEDEGNEQEGTAISELLARGLTALNLGLETTARIVMEPLRRGGGAGRAVQRGDAVPQASQADTRRPRILVTGSRAIARFLEGTLPVEELQHHDNGSDGEEFSLADTDEPPDLFDLDGVDGDNQIDLFNNPGRRPIQSVEFSHDFPTSAMTGDLALDKATLVEHARRLEWMTSDCVICRDVIAVGWETACKHIMRSRCAQELLRGRNVCPFCNQPMVMEEGRVVYWKGHGLRPMEDQRKVREFFGEGTMEVGQRSVGHVEKVGSRREVEAGED
jgi:hypothetical protein